MNATKIRSKHLARRAIVYLRQSTLRQVVEHAESTARQYALADRAEALGWPKDAVDIIDEDLGQSGATTEARAGFRRLAEKVGRGQIGALFALEVSRFARCSADWHQLLDLCGWGDVLIVDEQGVFDPKDPNDRLLLGLKGQMSEAEKYWMKLRMHGAKLSRARRGELPLIPPTGYVWDHEVGTLVLDPDGQVQAAIRLFFERFRTEGSAHGLQRWFINNAMKLPVRHRGKDEVQWTDPRPRSMLDILHNPIYAGAYVYGRRESRTTLIDGVRRTSIVALPMEQWQVNLPDRHPAYLSWEDYLENQDTLKANRSGSTTPGSHRVALGGSALLQGLVLCGKCGCRMHTQYAGKNRRVVYRCASPIRRGTSSRVCWTVSGAVIDEHVAAAFLESARPPELELALAVSREAERQAGKIDEQWRLRIERARYEARHAERRYKAVDPDNRVVARTLEAQWEEKLRELEHVDLEHERLRQRRKIDLTDEDRQRILGLARDLPRVWRSDTTTNQQRKNLLRILVREVTLTPIDVPRRGTRVQVLWESGAVTEYQLPRARHSNGSQVSREVEERIRELALKGHYDAEIAAELNSIGLVTGRQRRWSASAVGRARRRLGVNRPGARSVDQPVPHQREDGLVSTRGVAERFGVRIHTVNRWVKAGILDVVAGGGRGRAMWFRLDGATVAGVEAHMANVSKSRREGAS